jgi:hypothetical protein
MCQPLPQAAPCSAATNGSYPLSEACRAAAYPKISDRLKALIEALHQRFAGDIALCQVSSLLGAAPKPF